MAGRELEFGLPCCHVGQAGLRGKVIAAAGCKPPRSFSKQEMTMAKAADFLDDLTERTEAPTDPANVRYVAFGNRAKSSAEIEQRERDYLAASTPGAGILGSGPLWCVPIFSSVDNEYADIPADPKQLAAMEFDLQRIYGITVAEWREITRRKLE